MTHVATRLTKRQSTSGFDTVAEHYRNIREDAPVGSSLLSRLINSLSTLRYPIGIEIFRDCSRVIVESQGPLIHEKQGPPMESVCIDSSSTAVATNIPLSRIVKFDRFYSYKIERVVSKSKEIDEKKKRFFARF